MANKRIIEGFENYEVSETGEVFKGAKQLKPFCNPGGYAQVGLSKNFKQYTRLIHRLVAQAFCSNPLQLQIVDHIDGNRLNNNAVNLRWVSTAENANNRKRMRQGRTARGTRLRKGRWSCCFKEFVPQLNRTVAREIRCESEEEATAMYRAKTKERIQAYRNRK